MKKLPHDLSQLLNVSGKLPEIKEKAELLLRLDQLIKQQLQGPITAQIKVANLRESTLVVEVSSAAWAARLNFQKAQLLLQLQNVALPMLSTIDVKVNPRMFAVASNVEQNHAQLSNTAALHIEALAENIEGSLGHKLKRLAALASRKRHSDDD